MDGSVAEMGNKNGMASPKLEFCDRRPHVPAAELGAGEPNLTLGCYKWMLLVCSTGIQYKFSPYGSVRLTEAQRIANTHTEHRQGNQVIN
jgi:hypothetical protein